MNELKSPPALESSFFQIRRRRVIETSLGSLLWYFVEESCESQKGKKKTVDEEKTESSDRLSFWWFNEDYSKTFIEKDKPGQNHLWP